MLTEPQIRRYARHILLPELGGRGQERLLGGAVYLDLDAGGAAIAALAYLAAAGVGHLVVGGDHAGPVTEADLTSGILYGALDLGRPRLEALRDRVGRLNPDVTLSPGGPADAAIALGPLAPTATVADALVLGGGAAALAITALGARS